MRPQKRGTSVIGKNLTPTPSANASVASVRLRRASEDAATTRHSAPKRSTCPFPAPSIATSGFHEYASTHQGLRLEAANQYRRTATIAISHRKKADFKACAVSSIVITARKKSSAAAGYGVGALGWFISRVSGV